MRTIRALTVAGLMIGSAMAAPQVWASGSDTFAQNWVAAFAACSRGRPEPAPPAAETGSNVTNALAFGCQAGRDAAAAPRKGIPGPPSGFSYGSQLYRYGYESGWYASWFKHGATMPLPSDLWDFVEAWNAGFQAATDAQQAASTGAGGGNQTSSGGSGSDQGGGIDSGGSSTGGPPHAFSVGLVYPASGPAAGGNTVLIGGGIRSASAIYFGDRKASNIRYSPKYDTLFVTVPPGQPGTVAVSVVTSGGDSTYSSGGTYTYGPGPFTVGMNDGAISGTAPAGATLKAYLFCSGGCRLASGLKSLCSGRCTAESLGHAGVNADPMWPKLGAYRIPVTIPHTEPGVDSIVVGCDRCGTGWISLDGLWQQPSFTFKMPTRVPPGATPAAPSITSVTPPGGSVLGNNAIVIKGRGLSTVWSISFVSPQLLNAGLPFNFDGSPSGVLPFTECDPKMYCPPSQYGFRVVSDREIIAIMPPFMYAQPSYHPGCPGNPGSDPACTPYAIPFRFITPPLQTYIGLNTLFDGNGVTPSRTVPGDPASGWAFDAVYGPYTYRVTDAQPLPLPTDVGRPMMLLNGHFTSYSAAAAGQHVTVEGSGPPDAGLQTALFCSGGCGGRSVGPIVTDGHGKFSATFTLPATTTTDGPYTLEVGCNGAGVNQCNGWSGVTVVQASPGANPTAGSSAGSQAQPVATKVDPSSGSDRGDQTVTVTGRNLGGATAVLFGQAGPGTAVRVAPDGTSLTVVTPASSEDGPVDVRVRTASGTSAVKSTDQYTYEPATGSSTGGASQGGSGQTGGSPGQQNTAQPSGTPGVTGISPRSGTDSGGQTVTITGSNLTGATSVNFGDFGQGTDIQVAPDGNSLTVQTPQAWWGDGPAYVQVTTPGGTSTVTSATQFTFQAEQSGSPSGTTSGSSGSGSGPSTGSSRSTGSSGSTGSTGSSNPTGATGGSSSSPSGGGSSYSSQVDCNSPSVSPFDKQVAGCPGY